MKVMCQIQRRVESKMRVLLADIYEKGLGGEVVVIEVKERAKTFMFFMLGMKTFTHFGIVTMEERMYNHMMHDAET
jgi:hypothetical protein